MVYMRSVAFVCEKEHQLTWYINRMPSVGWKCWVSFILIGSVFYGVYKVFVATDCLEVLPSGRFLHHFLLAHDARKDCHTKVFPRIVSSGITKFRLPVEWRPPIDGYEPEYWNVKTQPNCSRMCQSCKRSTKTTHPPTKILTHQRYLPGFLTAANRRTVGD